MSFLLTPYKINFNDPHWKSKDDFNYYLSSARIWIECAFGELIMRWSIFWRRLLFDVEFCGDIIMASMLLHNFIIDHHAPYCVRDKEYFVNFNAAEELQFLHRSNAAESNIVNEELAIVAVADNDAIKPAG